MPTRSGANYHQKIALNARNEGPEEEGPTLSLRDLSEQIRVLATTMDRNHKAFTARLESLKDRQPRFEGFVEYGPRQEQIRDRPMGRNLG